MKIDKSPEIDLDNNTIKVSSNIDTDEEVWITINGMVQIEQDQITDITDDTITIENNLIEEFDDIIVLYTESE